VRVLVTGGAGFIGSAVVDLLVAEGHDAVVLDVLLPAAHRATPAYLNPRAEYVWADLADEAAVISCLRGVDAVSHQAAMVGLGLDLGDAPDYVRHNDLATAVLLRCLATAGFAGVFGMTTGVLLTGALSVLLLGIPTKGRSLEDGMVCPAIGLSKVNSKTNTTTRRDRQSCMRASQKEFVGDYDHYVPAECGQSLTQNRLSLNSSGHKASTDLMKSVPPASAGGSNTQHLS